ncbi:putative oxysterol-binding protein [Helianthus annuus]|nr:putative oxysterol-binding protein [Helianthus annuus]KAJ0944518.1 putative oxysterol-binding protein [Helianthus annuus]
MLWTKHTPRNYNSKEEKSFLIPLKKKKGVSLWSMIKDNVGKDLTRVCLPVYFNEPISSFQKCFEDLEYSYLLDRAYQHGKEVLDALIGLCCRTSISADALWDGGWLLRQLLPYCETEFNTHHIQSLKIETEESWT